MKAVDNLLKRHCQCELPISTGMFPKHLKDRNKALPGLSIPSNFGFVIHSCCAVLGGRRRAGYSDAKSRRAEYLRLHVFAERHLVDDFLVRRPDARWVGE